MKLLIISNAPIIKKGNYWFAYSPYVKEMEIWTKYADHVAFCCPNWENDNGLLISQIPFKISKIFLLSDFNIKSFKAVLYAFFQITYNFLIIVKAMFWADHIHLRCPGNVGLIASIAQLFFPFNVKTAKYAGNWDPNAKIPLSYKLQKKILSNTFLTKKMQVLVYGQWENQTANIKSFFTASYSDADKIEIQKKELTEKIKIIFVGTLSSGKRPLYAIQLVQNLLKTNYNIEFSLFGEGKERENLEKFIAHNSLQKNVFLLGNQTSDIIKKMYQESHFMLLPSKSEGWPKVVAESMFWGCVPISTAISCVPNMLDFGNRGLLLDLDLKNDANKISELIQNKTLYQQMIENGSQWSRNYTLDYFEQEIKLLLQE